MKQGEMLAGGIMVRRRLGALASTLVLQTLRAAVAFEELKRRGDIAVRHRRFDLLLLMQMRWLSSLGLLGELIPAVVRKSAADPAPCPVCGGDRVSATHASHLVDNVVVRGLPGLVCPKCDRVEPHPLIVAFLRAAAEYLFVPRDEVSLWWRLAEGWVCMQVDRGQERFTVSWSKGAVVTLGGTEGFLNDIGCSSQ